MQCWAVMIDFVSYFFGHKIDLPAGPSILPFRTQQPGNITSICQSTLLLMIRSESNCFQYLGLCLTVMFFFMVKSRKSLK